MSDLFINGQWIAGDGQPLVRRSPADESIVWSGFAASPGQARGAVQSAADACEDWSRCEPEDRVAYVRRFGEELTRRQEELAFGISHEVGKPVWESRTEVSSAIAKVELSISAMQHRRPQTRLAIDSYQAIGRYRPLGVMIVLGPFNFPAHLPGGQIIPALLAGNTIVFKPSEQAPGVAEILVQAWHSAGLPAGVINLLQGGADVGSAAIDHPGTGGVLFTGSHRVGCAIHRQLAGRPEVLLALEMGGNNPLVILDSEPHEAAIDLVIQSAFISSGQRCTCARRLIVVESDSNREFIERLCVSIRRIRCGLPSSDPAPFIGPLVSSQAAEAVLSVQSVLVDQGGSALVHAHLDARCSALVSPSLIDVTELQTPDEECFGPLLQLRWVKCLDEAIVAANDTRFGLAAGLIGGEAEEFDFFRKRIHAGVINWNRQTTGASGQLAFGGLGASGNHRPGGYFAVDFCSDPIASLESSVLSRPSVILPGLEDIFP